MNSEEVGEECQGLIEEPGPSRLSLRMKLAAASLAAGLLALGLWLPQSRSLRGADLGATGEAYESGGCDAPLLDFYMYRAQMDENYSPVNQDMANIGGMLWYLHNEIIWHHWIRVGSFSSIPKTRLERWRVKVRPTCALWEKGMHFGIVNTYDLGACTGPFKCENLEHYGPTVGCETWNPGTNNHWPHNEWFGQNKYPNAAWYSLPGECYHEKFWGKDAACASRQPSGACPPGKEPTGAWDCTYSYEKVGELSIDELEGIGSFDALMKSGGYEYSRATDQGKKLHFWDHKMSPAANQRRIDITLQKFKNKYPEQPDLEDPTCDFDPEVFFPHWPQGHFN